MLRQPARMNVGVASDWHCDADGDAQSESGHPGGRHQGVLLRRGPDNQSEESIASTDSDESSYREWCTAESPAVPAVSRRHPVTAISSVLKTRQQIYDAFVKLSGLSLRPDFAPPDEEGLYSLRPNQNASDALAKPRGCLAGFARWAAAQSPPWGLILPAISSSLILAFSTLGYLPWPLRVVVFSLEMMLLHVAVPVLQTMLSDLRGRLEDIGQTGYLPAVTMLPLFSAADHSEAMAAYGEFQTAGSLWIVRAVIMAALSVGQIFAKASKHTSGICVTSCLPLLLPSISQLALAPWWGRLRHSRANLLHLAGHLWMAFLLLATAVAALMSDTCDIPSGTSVEQEFQLPISGEPTVLQLVSHVFTTTLAWGVLFLVLMPTSLKWTAWAMLLLCAGSMAPRLATLSCRRIEMNGSDDGWAMAELSFLSFATSFGIIFACRIYLEEFMLHRFIYGNGLW